MSETERCDIVTGADTFAAKSGGLPLSAKAGAKKSRRGVARGGSRILQSLKRLSVLGRPGSDLLFQALRLSTIGAGEFDGRVRDGIGYRLPANTTRPAKDASGISQSSSDSRQAGLYKSRWHRPSSHE